MNREGKLTTEWKTWVALFVACAAGFVAALVHGYDIVAAVALTGMIADSLGYKGIRGLTKWAEAKRDVALTSIAADYSATPTQLARSLERAAELEAGELRKQMTPEGNAELDKRIAERQRAETTRPF